MAHNRVQDCVYVIFICGNDYTVEL